MSTISLLIAASAFLGGFAIGVLPIFFSASSLHGYVEWNTPWRMWASAVSDLFKSYTWRNRRPWFGRLWAEAIAEHFSRSH